jgi:hypothetical protein
LWGGHGGTILLGKGGKTTNEGKKNKLLKKEKRL